MQPFDKYLQDVHAKQYTGLDDEMSDDYEKWEANLDPGIVIVLANHFIQDLIKK
jgi:hypothetical protein